MAFVSSNISIDQQIFDLWRMRRCGETAKSEEGLIHLRRLLGISLRLNDWNMDCQKMKDLGLSEASIIDLYILKISILLRAGDARESLKQITSLRKLMDREGWLPTFQFEFQYAAIAYVLGDYITALHGFARASEKAVKNTYQHWQTRLNKILVSESLGFMNEEDLRNVTEEIAASPVASDMDLPTRHQIIAAELRLHFATRPLRELARFLEVTEPAEQAQYYAGWISSLPYLRREVDPHKSKLERAKVILMNVADGYQARYRFNTLSGIENDTLEADTCPNAGDSSERLYLWTWNWLFNPTPRTALSIVTTAKQILETHVVTRSKDRILIENALGWALLFTGHDPGIYLSSDSWMDGGDHSVPRSVRLENLVLNSVRWSDRGVIFEPKSHITYENLRNDAVEFGLCDLVKLFDALILGCDGMESMFDSRLESLRATLNRMSAKPQDIAGVIRAQSLSGRVQVFAPDEKYSVHSSHATLLVALFCNRTSVPCSDVLIHCLKQRYEEIEAGLPKIDKLLWRCNKDFKGSLKFTRRHESVFLETAYEISADVDSSYRSLTPLADDLSKISAALTRGERFGESGRSEPVMSNTNSGVRRLNVSRKDLETAMKISRPSANRILKKWIDLGKAKQVCDTPVPLYSISADLLTRGSNLEK